MIILSEQELELLKKQIKIELQAKMPCVQEKEIPLLETKQSYFYGNGGYNKYCNSVMENEFGCPGMHKVWDMVRRLTTLIMGKQYYQQLCAYDSEICNMVCSTICETIIKLKTSPEVQNEIAKSIRL